MKRLAPTAGILGAVIAVVAAAVGGWMLLGGASGQAYPTMSQVRDEPVPGTLELHLAPPPSGFASSVTPDEAFALAFEAPPRGEVTRTLAVIDDVLNSQGGTAGAPAWVFFVRGVCYPQDKGDTVSASRSGLDSPCGPDDLAITTVDASGKDQVLSFSAVDISEQWIPANDAPLVVPASQASEAQRSSS